MRLKLYSNYINSAGERVRIAMALKGIEYEYVSVSSIGWDAYQKINPQRLMPALEVDGQIVPQSSAILEYLEELYPDPPLLPPDPILRARSRGFAQHIVSEMHAIDVIRVRRFLHTGLGLDAGHIRKWQLHWFATGFSALEALLMQRETDWPFCFGDAPGWADLHLVPQVHKGISRFNVDMSTYPLIGGVYDLCAPMPAFANARPEAMPDYPGELVEPDMTTEQTNKAGL